MHLRPAAQEDGPAVADLIRRSKAAAMPWLAVVHTPEEDLAWVSGVLLVQHEVVVVREDDGPSGAPLVGVRATSRGWLDQLYVMPGRQGGGVGGTLLRDHLDHAGDDVQLWAFARNTRARAFYERHGFTLEESTDGAGNEELEPDVRYRWRPTAR